MFSELGDGRRGGSSRTGGKVRVGDGDRGEEVVDDVVLETRRCSRLLLVRFSFRFLAPEAQPFGEMVAQGTRR